MRIKHTGKGQVSGKCLCCQAEKCGKPTRRSHGRVRPAWATGASAARKAVHDQALARTA